MNMGFKAFASILTGICLIGVSIGFLLGFYIRSEYPINIIMYLSAPCLGIGSGLIVYGTLYGRQIKE